MNKLFYGVIFIIALSLPFDSEALELHLNICAGISDSYGSGSQYWKLGYCAGVNIFYPFSNNLVIGGRIAINRWKPSDKSNIEGEIWDPFGYSNIFEILPILRIFPVINEETMFKFFLQFGAGFYLMETNAKIQGTSSDPNRKYFTVFKAEPQNKFGAVIGCGVLVGKIGAVNLEVCPNFHIIFRSDDYTNNEYQKYYSIDLGFSFGL